MKRETQIEKEGSEKIRSAKSERVARGRRVPGQRAPARADSGGGGDGRDQRRWQRAARLGFCFSTLSHVCVLWGERERERERGGRT